MEEGPEYTFFQKKKKDIQMAKDTGEDVQYH